MRNGSLKRGALQLAIVLALLASISGMFLAVRPHITHADNGITITEFPLPPTTNPSGITAGPDGNLWFTNYNNGSIGRITTTGTVTLFPGAGERPIGITAGPDGNLWFTNSFASTLLDPVNIGRITPTGTITLFPDSDVHPIGITAGPDGNLWFAAFSDSIGRITPTGTITLFPAPGSNSDITAGPDGNLWFTDSGNIGRITPTGTVTLFPVPTSNVFPTSITAGPDGNLWFTDYNGNIGRITPTGTITLFPVPTSNSGLNGITAGPDGNLWFTDPNGNSIGRITPTGTVTLFPVPTSNSGLNGITAGPDGNLWFTEGIGNIGQVNLNNVCPVVVGAATTTLGARTAATTQCCPPGNTLSGPSWVAQFPTSTSTNDLAEPFRSDVNSFLAALSQAGASVTITATYRPPQRAYLMHWAWRIVKQGYDPRTVPPMAGVPICWVHTNPDGSYDRGGSINAAKQMVTAYAINSLKVAPSLYSNHTKGLAIDMNISWSGILTITDNNGNVVTISSPPRSGMNPALWKVGASYGVLKFCYGIANCQPSKDKPHWSIDGH